VTRLTFLGVGAALNSSSNKSATLFGGTILVDTGADIVPGLRRTGVDPNDISLVLLTHLHGDHFFGTGFLIAEAYALAEPRKSELVIVGPPGTEDAIRGLLGLAYPVSDPESFLTKGRVTFLVAEPGENVDEQGISISVYSANHGRMPALSYRLADGSGQSFYFSGDGTIPPELQSMRSSTHLIVNTPTLVEQLPGHASLADYTRLVESGALNPVSVFVCHRSFDAELAEPFWLPQDGQSFDLNVDGVDWIK
jgi:ribonuclease BN (tRNA processing enzyme)